MKLTYEGEPFTKGTSKALSPSKELTELAANNFPKVNNFGHQD